MSETPMSPDQEQNPRPEATHPVTRAEARARQQAASAGAGEAPPAEPAAMTEAQPAVSADALPAQPAELPVDASNPAAPRDAAVADSPLTPVAPAAPADAQFPTSPVLDDGTYTKLKEPRSSGRLALDGVWHQISPKYLVSQIIQSVIFIAVVAGIAIALSLMLDSHLWIWIPAGVIILFTLVPLVVLPRQVRALGYMLREDDIVFRKGILWQRMVAVPYGRLQLVDISHGPMDRGFGIAKLKLITAAATTGVEVPGLRQKAAESLRDTLIEVAEERRTGL